MIVPTLARLLIREHHYKPIQGTVLTLGRQTIGLTYEQLVKLTEQEGLSVPDNILQEISQSKDHMTRYGKETKYISDDAFFNIFGINKLKVMDVTNYEGADIIHDLNMPVPDSLMNKYDFIIDGGTFDHLIDLRVAFENVVKMLKVGGRIFQWNAVSNFCGAAYLSVGPDLFYDYYVQNMFDDCKVYVAEVDSFGQPELWDIYEFDGAEEIGHLKSKRIQMSIVLGEKGSSSTWDKLPIQSQYRDDNLRQLYQNRRIFMSGSSRPSFIKSRSDQRLTTVPSHILSLVNKIREKGVKWAYKRFMHKYVTHGVKGFTYIGKI